MSSNQIAVLGYSLRFPGANVAEKFWTNLRNGVVSIQRHDLESLRYLGISSDIYNASNYISAEGSIDNIDKFDCDFFGYNHREASVLDPQQRFFLECAWELLEGIGYGQPIRRVAVGVFASASMNTYLSNIIGQRCNPASLTGTELMLTNDKDYLAPRVSYKLGLTGPSVMMQTGCSSSLVAIHHACQSLLSGECDLAIAGGVSINIKEYPGYFYETGAMFSRDGVCRPFDTKANGTVFGNGCGIVALRRLDDATADGDPIRSTILGSTVNNDGSDKVGFTAPSVSGQTALIQEALTVSDVDPREIGFIETHGTGTELGDPIELRALHSVFKGTPHNGDSCVLGAVKANIGHLAAASGVAGFIKASLCTEHGEIPPHPTFQEPCYELATNKDIFHINKSHIKWPNKVRRIAGISSFGVGGSNAHVIVSDYKTRKALTDRKRPFAQGLPLSAPTEAALEELSLRLASNLEASEDIDLNKVANTLQTGRPCKKFKRFVSGNTKEEITYNLKHSENLVVESVDNSKKPIVLFIDSSPLWETVISAHFYQEAEKLLLELPQQLHIYNEKILGAIQKRNLKTLEKTENKLALLIVRVSAIRVLIEALNKHPITLISDGFGAVYTACALGIINIENAFLCVLGKQDDKKRVDKIICSSLKEDKFYSLSKYEPGYTTTHSPNTSKTLRFLDKIESFFLLPLGTNESLLNKLQSPNRYTLLDIAKCENGLTFTLGSLWLQNIHVNWEVLDKEKRGRVWLPVHPLSTKRCWVEKLEKHDTSLCRNYSEDEKIYSESWSSSNIQPSPLRGKQNEKVFLFCGSVNSTSEHFAQKLKNNGHSVFFISDEASTNITNQPNIIGQEKLGHISHLCSTIRKDGVIPDDIIFSFDHPQLSFRNSTEPLHQLFSFLELLKEIQKISSNHIDIHILTQDAVSILGNEQIKAHSSMAYGLVPTIPQEYPTFSVQCIDTSSNTDMDCLYSEIVSPIKDTVVAIRGKKRWVRRFFAAEEHLPLTISPNKTCLITGGLGTVGMTLGELLAKKYNLKLALVTRTTFPERQNWESILAERDTDPILKLRIERLLSMERKNIQFCIVTADVANFSQMQDAISYIDHEIGSIHTFIHAAGLSGKDIIQPIAKTVRSDWEKIIEPKILGALYLHKALLNRPIEFGCFISSLATISGGIGLCPYSIANSFLSGFVQKHKTTDKNYCALNWDGWDSWDDGGLYQSKVSNDKRRLWAFSNDEAKQIFSRTLAFTNSPVLLLLKNYLEKRIQEAGSTNIKNNYDVFPNSKKHFSATPPQNIVSQALTELWKETLQCNIDPESNFFDLGGDSLIGALLVKRTNELFGITLSIVDLFDYPTIVQLADKIRHETYALEKRNH